MQPAVLIQMMGAFASLQKLLSDQLTAALQSKAVGSIDKMSAKQLTLMLRAFAAMDQTLSRKLQHAVVVQISKLCSDRNGLSPHNAADILWGLAKLVIRVEPSVLIVIVSRSVKLSTTNEKLSNGDLIRLIESLSLSCGLYNGDPQKLMRRAVCELAPQAVRQCEHFSLEQISSLIVSLTGVQVTVAPLLVEVLYAQAGQVTDNAYAKQLSAHAVVQTLWAFASLRKHPGAALMESLRQKVGEFVDLFQVRDVALLLQSLGSLQETLEPAVCERVLSKTASLVEKFDTPSIVQVLWGWAKIQTNVTGDTIKRTTCRLVDRIRNAPQMTAQQMCDIMWAVANLPVDDPEQLLAQWSTNLIQLGTTLTAADMLSVLTAHIALQVLPADPLTKLISDQISSDVQSYTALEVASLIHSFGCLRLHPGDHALAALYDKIHNFSTKSQLQTDAVARTLRGFAALGMSSGQEVLLAALIQQALLSASRFEPREVADAICAFSQLKVRPGQELTTLLLKRAMAFAIGEKFSALDVVSVLTALASSPQEDLAGKQLVLCALLRLAVHLNSQLGILQLSEVIRAVVTFDMAIPPRLTEALHKQLTEIKIMKQTTGPALAEAVSALAALGKRADLTLLRAVYARAAEVTAEFNSRDVGLILRGAAKLGEPVGEQLVTALSGRMAELILELAPQELCDVLWGMAKLKLQFAPDVNNALIERALAIVDTQFTAEHLAEILWAVASVFTGGEGQKLLEKVSTLCLALCIVGSPSLLDVAAAHSLYLLCQVLYSLLENTTLLQPADVVHVLLAFSALKVSPDSKLIKSLVSRTIESIDLFTADQMIVLMSVFEQLKIPFEIELIQVLHQRTLMLSHRLSAQHITTLTNAFSALQVKPDATVLSALSMRALENNSFTGKILTGPEHRQQLNLSEVMRMWIV